MIWRPPNTKQAKQNKCIQRNNTCKRPSIIWRSPDTKQAKRNKRI
nr:hypothetical protein [Staphylococcus aureus]